MKPSFTLVIFATFLLYYLPIMGQGLGNKYALFFYVTNYSKGWANLPETKNECISLSKELKENYNFICDTIDNPSKEVILQKIQAYNQKLNSEDQLFIYFSMHGEYLGERGYLIPKDGIYNDSYGNTWLSYDDLKAYLSKCRARYLFVALDACHSGAFGLTYKGQPSGPLYELPEDCSTTLKKAMQFQSRVYISSGSKDAKTPSKSIFASRFLEVLRKGNTKGIINFEQIRYHLGSIDLPRPEGGTFNDHEPGGDYLFVKKNSCVIEIQSLKEEKFWQKANEKNTINTYEDYIRQYPKGKYATIARNKIKTLAQSTNLPITTITDSLNIQLVLIKGGTFNMGCTSEQKDCADDEKPVHQVTLSNYYLSPYEVTQKQWRLVMGYNPSGFKDCDECPVESVSWNAIELFLSKLNKITEKKYRLPTEAEWEYAAREGGKEVMFGNGKNIGDPNEINFDGSGDYKLPYTNIGIYRNKTTPVGSFAPNKLGLFDMSGNVLEYCSDWFGSYPQEHQTNPQGPSTGSYKIGRGGSYYGFPNKCRVSYRYYDSVDKRYANFGFRLAMNGDK
jgi:formylglycine-generating enzyme required for sulfatase activity